MEHPCHLRIHHETLVSLENFSPIEVTTERALENRIADIEIRTNDLVDETDTIANMNNNAIESFTSPDSELQQSVDLSA